MSVVCKYWLHKKGIDKLSVKNILTAFDNLSKATKTLLILLLIFIIALTFNQTGVKGLADTNEIQKVYSSKICLSCGKFESEVKKLGVDLPIVYIEDERYLEEYRILQNEHDKLLTLPVIVLEDGTLISGLDNSLEFVKSGIKNETATKRMGLAGIVVAGLIDSINPCALAALMFILAYLKKIEASKLRVIKTGVLFAATIFSVYFLLGIVLIELGKQLVTFPYFGFIVGMVVLILSVLGIYSSVDQPKCKGGICMIEEPSKAETWISKTLNSNAITTTGVIVTGAVVALAEFGCTGQIYIPTIAWTVGTAKELVIPYLAVYNLLFIAPILGLTALYYFVDVSKFGIGEKTQKLLSLLLFSSFTLVTLLYYFL